LNSIDYSSSFGGEGISFFVESSTIP